MQWTTWISGLTVAVAAYLAPVGVAHAASAEPAAVLHQGMIQEKAAGDLDAVWNRLLGALKELKAPIFAQVDHKANAETVGLTMPGARVVTFGNPAVGTALMQKAPSAALDLPLRMVVWESPAGVMIAWNDPVWIAERHGLPASMEVLAKMRGMLEKLAKTAAHPAG